MRLFKLSFIFIVIFLSSCKKDRLKDGKEIFIGKWVWVYSIGHLNICGDFPQYNTILSPDNQDHNYEIEFLKKGKVHFYKDGELINQHRVVFLTFDSPNLCNEAGYKSFAINLDNDPGTEVTKGLEGCISNDTLRVGRGFPYYDDGCSFYSNHFVRK